MTTIAAAASPDGPVVNDAAEARRPTALLDWSLHVDCPKCGLSNDLASGLHDAEHSIARHIFTNAWEKLGGWEVTCEGCEHEFTIERVEY
jgi:hypothetical protein